MAKRGRPAVQDRNEVRKRATITILPEVQEMAKLLGDGNISRGIEIAIQRTYGNDKTVCK